MRILVLGSGGMVGHLVTLYLCERGHQVTGFTRFPISYCENIIGDALDIEDIRKAVYSQQYDAIINCIGILNNEVDKNMAEGIYINSYLPHLIVSLLENKGTKLIQLSTDCVFSGGIGGYYEDSPKDSETMYGKTKSLGEIINKNHLTIRTSIIGPDLKETGVGLLNWFLKQNDSVKGYSSVKWTGVSTITLSRAIEQAIEDDLSGLYHLVNNQIISKYELLILFNKWLKRKPIEIIPDNDHHVNKSLVNSRDDFDFVVPSYEQMILDTKYWIEAHRDLYIHYY